MSRNTPEPAQMAEAFDNKFGTYFEVNPEEVENESRRKHVTILRTEEGMGDSDSITSHPEPWTQPMRFMTANGYFPVESEGHYIVFAHPKDRILRRMQSDRSGTFSEKYSAWEYMDS